MDLTKLDFFRGHSYAIFNKSSYKIRENLAGDA